MPRGLVHRFGPFELDLAARRLFRDGEPVSLSEKPFALLIKLVEHAGEIVSTDDLLDAAWPDDAVTDNNLDQVISRLRRRLWEEGADEEYIETVAQKGYRFVAPVEVGPPRLPDTELDQLLAPFRAVDFARTALDTLDLPKVRQALAVLETTVRDIPQSHAALLDMALACALVFESDATALATLRRGIEYARQACSQNRASAPAFSRLSYLHGLHGDSENASAAAIIAMELEPDSFMHALLAARVSWGEKRLRAARRVLELFPGLALAYWLVATVLIARGTHDLALAEVRLGCAAQDAHSPGASLPALGNHLLDGHLLLARGLWEAAIAAIMRELAKVERSTHVHARECGGNCWYVIGAIHRQQGRHEDARDAFIRALTIDPTHIGAAAILRGDLPTTGSPMDIALAKSIIFARAGQVHEAEAAYREGVLASPPGWAGWMLSVEPILRPWAHPEIWTPSLALIRHRAI